MPVLPILVLILYCVASIRLGIDDSIYSYSTVRCCVKFSMRASNRESLVRDIYWRHLFDHDDAQLVMIRFQPLGPIVLDMLTPQSPYFKKSCNSPPLWFVALIHMYASAWSSDSAAHLDRAEISGVVPESHILRTANAVLPTWLDLVRHPCEWRWPSPRIRPRHCLYDQHRRFCPVPSETVTSPSTAWLRCHLNLFSTDAGLSNCRVPDHARHRVSINSDRLRPGEHTSVRCQLGGELLISRGMI